MKKNIIALFALLSLTTMGYAQTPEAPAAPVAPAAPDTAPAKATAQKPDLQRFSLGLRGGAALNVGKAESVKSKSGADLLFDMQYSAYWRKNTTELGLLVGASFGYMQTGLKLSDPILDNYTIDSPDGTVNYTITADGISEKRQQALFEIPLMFSLIDDCGVFFNVGPRIVLPMWSRSKVEYSDANVIAYFPTEMVDVPNELVTGKPIQTDVAEWNAPKMNLLLGFELGYEWKLDNLDALGLGIYMDYNVCSVYKDRASNPRFVSINGFAPAEVKIISPKDVYASKQSTLDFGLKLTYHFTLGKDKAAAAPAAPAAE